MIALKWKSFLVLRIAWRAHSSCCSDFSHASSSSMARESAAPVLRNSTLSLCELDTGKLPFAIKKDVCDFSDIVIVFIGTTESLHHWGSRLPAETSKARTLWTWSGSYQRREVGESMLDFSIPLRMIAAFLNWKAVFYFAWKGMEKMEFTEEMQQVNDSLRMRDDEYPVAKRNATGRLAMMERCQLKALKEAGVLHVE